MKKLLFVIFLLSFHSNFAQNTGNQYNANTQFEQMGGLLPTPNTYRTASGLPGKDYWQQKADYDIKVELDDQNQRIIATEKITYLNNSPDLLTYLWLQLDQNLFSEKSDAKLSRQSSISHERGATSATLSTLDHSTNKDYGFKIRKVTDKLGKGLKYTIVGTMMRIDLPVSISKGQSFVFNVDWDFNIIDANAQRGRSGYEYFEKDGNYLYEMAQWFPRMCAYDDVNGWQHKQFLGQGEFTLVFGDYKVAITAPNDMVVGATGELQNPKEALTLTQQKRLLEAENSKNPYLIVSQSEAENAEKGKPSGKKTWIYSAKNVRDFAFAASRKFIWDAMRVDIEGKKVWAMSLYPKEGNPLWGQYSTRLVAHTLEQYSKRTFAYPYPVAYSVHGPVGGMEYPMMSFNGARPQADGTYPESTKNFLILVIIHEVGHNFFPMIVNSDERQWSWMDEGLNSFLEGVVCREWDRDFPADGIEPQHIIPYMKLDPQSQNSIMTSSDNILPGTFGPNAYSKPATGLNILRETIMGRELFDYAFKEYSRRWAFKSPTPADFFRTMEDASGVDLDWFWKGWFYGVENLDQAIAEVQWYSVDNQSPQAKKDLEKIEAEKRKQSISYLNNKKDIKETVVEADSSMKDFYNNWDRFKASEKEKSDYEKYKESLSKEEKELLESSKHYYVLKLKNEGGLVMPVIVQAVYEDGTNEVFKFPVEIWRLNNKEIQKTIVTRKKVDKFKLDPYFELPDVDPSDNVFPKEPEQPTRFQLMKQQSTRSVPNPMQEAKQNNTSGALGGSGKN